MADDSVIGKRFPGYEFTIERGKVREFARATMTREPRLPRRPRGRRSRPRGSSRPGSGRRDDLENPVASLNINLARLLHGGQEFVVLRPAADAPVPSSPPSRGSTSIYEKEGKRGGTMRFAEMVTEYRDESGKVVAESRTTMIETGKAPTEGS